MKTILTASARILGLLLIITTFASAQSSPIDKGSRMFTLGMLVTNYQTDAIDDPSDDDINRLTSYQVNTSSSYFLGNGVALGMKAILTGAFYEEDFIETSWHIGPHLLYFFGRRTASDRPRSTYPYIGLSGAFGRTRLVGLWDADEIIVAMGGGLLYMVTETAAVTIEMGYQENRRGDIAETVDSDIEKDYPRKRSERYNVMAGLVVFL
ncbi:hypothetical protein ACFL5M_02365 [Candidatus Neomarinimicrobiota bacterium]